MVALLVGILLAGSLVALADVATSYESELRSFTRRHWMSAVMVPVVGPLLWSLYGRPRLVKAPPALPTYFLESLPTDDNPAFIAHLEQLIAARRRSQAQG